MSGHNLESMFSPRSIAVIGAAREHMKMGNATLLNVLVHGFEGKIYPINPKADTIMGLKCYPSVLDVPDEIDLAIIVIPAKYVPGVMEDCAKKGIKSVIIISAGFGEIGGEGKVLEDKVLEIARRSGIRVIGPNTMGYKSPVDNLDASFVFGMAYPGDIALASQSGALAIGMIAHANMEMIGLSRIISVGNKIDVDDAELIEYLDSDDKTKVITMYIEGIKDGRRFFEAAKKSSKPIVVIKSGRTKAGAAAAKTHTGSLSGSDVVYNSIFRQAGIHRARDATQLFDFARALANLPLPKGRNVGIVTNGGGAGILMSDFCEMKGLNIVQPSEETKVKLREILPSISVPRNPVDVIGDAGFFRYYASAKALLEDPDVDGVIVISVHGGYARPREFVGAILKLYEDMKEGAVPEKPVIVCWVGGKEYSDVVFDLKIKGIPAYPTTERAAAAMNVLVEEHERRERMRGPESS